MTILGIETSCDETALALMETRNDNGALECRIISSLIHSQAAMHEPYGGVYPNLAKREHGKHLPRLLEKLLEDAGLERRDLSKAEILAKRDSLERFYNENAAKNPDLFEALKGTDFLETVPAIDCLAVTAGPGLEPALWVGINFAKILSLAWSKPLVAVNHMEGHVLGSLLESDKADGKWQKLKTVRFPALALLISGGHTELVTIKSRSDMNNGAEAIDYEVIGRTRDDALGEAFDKAARLLGLPYPGGPQISRLAEEARRSDIIPSIRLPRPMMKSGDLDFSFSGLKTAVLYAVRAHQSASTETFKRELALEFEEAVADVLDHKLRAAIEKTGAKTLIVGGGASANKRLRQIFQKTADELSLPLYLPSGHVSGDNALMIALAGAFHSGGENTDMKADGGKRIDA